MSDPSQLPHMLRLRDDASPKVKSAIRKPSTNRGGTLREDPERLCQVEQVVADTNLAKILGYDNRVWLKNVWLTYSTTGSYADYLEYFSAGLSSFLEGRLQTNQTGVQLDRIAANFARSGNRINVKSLSRY